MKTILKANGFAKAWRAAGAALAAAFMLAASPSFAATTYIPIIVPAAQPAPVTQKGDYSALHNVAVVSAIGDKLTLRNQHFLNNQTKDMDIRDWNIDAGVEERLRQYLSGRFTFKDIMYDRSQLAKIANGPWDSSARFTDFIKAIPHDGIDAFIVVRPDLELGAPGPEGIALENTGNPALWTNFEIDVVDAQSARLIAKASSRIRLRADSPAMFAGLPAPASLKLDDNFKMTPAQIVSVRGAVSIMMNISLLETIRDLDFGVALPLAGARTLVPIPPDRNPYKDFKNVAVVSALGDSIGLHHLGGTVLSQDHYQVDEPDWHLDSYVENRVRGELAKQFHVVDPKVDRTAFANAQMWDADGKPAPSFPGLMQDPGIDLYVVVIKLGTAFSAINFPKMAGVGVFDHTPIAGPESTAAYAHFAIVVIDAHTMKYIVARGGTVGPDHPGIEPSEDVGSANWPAQPPALTPDQAAAVHSKVLDVLNASVDETLLQLALLGVITVQGPPAGPSGATVQAQIGAPQ